MKATNLGIIIPKGVENLQLPDDSLLNFYEGLEERVFWINDEINIYSLNLIHYIIKWNREDKDLPIEQRKPIKLFFFSPGGVIDKLYPYLAPMADQLGSQIILDDYIEKGKIEPVHLGFLRGRDLRHSLIYCTEAQNLSVDHMKLLIGRVSEGSELWCDGDFTTQVDRSTFERSNGLHTIVESKGKRTFRYVQLRKSERSKIAALADLLD